MLGNNQTFSVKADFALHCGHEADENTSVSQSWKYYDVYWSESYI